MKEEYLKRLDEYTRKTPIVSTKVYINKSGVHGFGCFAAQKIKKFELIENVYCDIVDTADMELFDKRFSYPSRENCLMFVLPRGNGVYYNHSDDPNADWVTVSDFMFSFYAIKDIEKYEEIFTSYGPKWWELRNAKEKR